MEIPPGYWPCACVKRDKDGNLRKIKGEKYSTMLTTGGARSVILVDTWQAEIVFIGNTHVELAKVVAEFLNQREAEMVTKETESVS